MLKLARVGLCPATLPALPRTSPRGFSRSRIVLAAGPTRAPADPFQNSAQLPAVPAHVRLGADQARLFIATGRLVWDAGQASPGPGQPEPAGHAAVRRNQR